MQVINNLKRNSLKSSFYFLSSMLTFIYASDAHSYDIYRSTWVARIYNNNLRSFPIGLPVNPATSDVLAKIGNSFYISSNTKFSDGCSGEIGAQHVLSSSNFDNMIPFSSRKLLDDFLWRKFHDKSSNWNTIYFLKKNQYATCGILSSAKIYESSSALFILSGDFLYKYELENAPFRDATKGFDCSKARTHVEHLVCSNPALREMDANVNYGFTAMQYVYSKEISLEDPVRIDQMKWLSNVRNKCKTNACLVKVYTDRIKYIKYKVRSDYPSYPDKGP